MTVNVTGTGWHWRRPAVATVVLAALLAVPQAFALDPPHDATISIECLTCHIPHGAADGRLTRVAGNPNLCMSCHNPGGDAAALPLADADQALPGVTGTSHRWDSGPSGRVEPALTNSSSGRVRSGGVFSGRVEKTFTLTIVTGGESGVATFDWSDDVGGGAAGVSTGADIPLIDGLVLDFVNGAIAPSFFPGDTWILHVRTDLRLPDLNDPFERPLAQRLTDVRRISGVFDFTYSKVVCSVCHDQHTQRRQPFDAAAPAYGGSGTGAGRHFQRQDNDVNQMCVICHRARNVQQASDGSHPVSVPVPAGDFQQPAVLPLDPGSNVVCMSCHAPHFTDSGGANGGQGDGYLLRLSIGTLCDQCHTLADKNAGSHFDPVAGALWPGGQYGSSFPAHSGDKRGTCVNCHWPHGWVDDATPTQDYSRLWLERYDTTANGTDPNDAEDLCFTCHDGSPAATNIRADILKGSNGTDIFHHPVMDSEQTMDVAQGIFRSVECVNCHNPHKARPDNRLAGVAGTNVDGTAAAEVTETEQFKLCFNCHGDNYNRSRALTSNKRLDFASSNSAYHPVTQAGRNQSQNLAEQLAASGLNTSSLLKCTDCHNSDVTGATPGPVVDSAGLTQGPHGSIFAPILRANFNRNYQVGSTPANYNSANYSLCFLCHNETALMARRRSDGARTNFYDGINGADNLHWLHLNDRADKTRATCMNCHFDIHSNITAANTQYRIDGVLYADNTAVSAAGRKTHMVNFSPDTGAYTDDGVFRAKPEWWLSTATGERRCFLACHGENMAGQSGDNGKRAQYRPPAGDEVNWTFTP